MASIARFVERLHEGGERIVTGWGGRTPYGCFAIPRPDTLELGSCTASSISPLGWRAASEADDVSAGRSTDEWAEAVRQDIAATLGIETMADVAIAHSGTSAEYLVSSLSLRKRRRLTVVMPGAGERGSGSALAGGGRHYFGRTPDGMPAVKGAPAMPWADRVEVKDVPLRDEQGEPLAPQIVEERVVDAIEGALRLDRDVLLHQVFQSKTGLTALRQGAVRSMEETFGPSLKVAVDAAQGRIDPATIRESLQAGRIIIFTGSKFFGGPVFCGAVLIPKTSLGEHSFSEELASFFPRSYLPSTWPGARALRDAAAPGPLLRWAAGLAEMKRFLDLPQEAVHRAIDRFGRLVADAFTGQSHLQLLPEATRKHCGNRHPLEALPTIFPFRLLRGGRACSQQELRELVQNLYSRNPPCHLGQPMACGSSGVLRISLGAPLLWDLAGDVGRGTAWESASSKIPKMLTLLGKQS